jgi:hypothetical protein
VAEPVTEAALGPGACFSLIMRSERSDGLFSRAASAPEPIPLSANFSLKPVWIQTRKVC